MNEAMKPLTVGSLFSGIGGIDLGLQQAGMEIKWQCEKDPWCRNILAKHWPEVPKYEDVTTLDPQAVEYVDVLAGGFPCQDLSVAGKRAGLREGTRSGLWLEFARLIRGIRPKYVLVENVPGLLANHALGRVLGDLAECGYDAEWDCLSAAAFGAHHRRDRIWIVGINTYSNYECTVGTSQKFQQIATTSGNSQRQGANEEILHTNSDRLETATNDRQVCQQRNPIIANNGIKRMPMWDASPPSSTELCGIPDGLPNRVHRLRGLGNAVVPQIVEWLGRCINASHRA